MKYIIILFLASTSFVKAQESTQNQDYFNIGLGLHFQGSGDYLIPKLDFGYGVELGSGFLFGTEIQTGYWEWHERNINEHDILHVSISFQLDPSIQYYLINNRNIKLKIGLGPSVIYRREASTYEYITDVNGDRVDFLTDEMEFTYGGHVWPEVDIRLNSRLVVFLRSMLQGYFNGDMTTGGLIGINVY